MKTLNHKLILSLLTASIMLQSFSSSALTCRRLFSKDYLDKLRATQEVDDYKNGIKVLDRLDPDQVDDPLKGKAIREAVDRAEKLLQKMNINYEVDKESNRILIFSPWARGQHNLNRLARGIYKRWGNYIELNPLLLFEDKAGAMFDSERKRLTISNDEIALLELNDFGLHEIRHAYYFYKAFRDHVDHIFLGEITSVDSKPEFHETYPHYVSVDELGTYTYQMLVRLRNTVSAMKAKDQKFLDEETEFNSELARIGQTIMQPVRDLSHKALQATNGFAKNPQSWKIVRKKETVDEVEKDFIYVRNKHDNSYFKIYSTPMVESQPDGKHLTRVAFTRDGYTIETYLLTPLDAKAPEKQVASLIEHAEKKWQGLNTTAIKLHKAFSKVESLLEADKVPEALTTIQEVRDLIAI